MMYDNYIRDDEIAEKIDANHISLQNILEIDPELIYDKVTGHIFINITTSEPMERR